MTTMTFEQFQATRVRVEDLRPLCDQQGLEHEIYPGPGYVYLGCLVIEITEGGVSLVIANCEYTEDLITCERILYQWAIDEEIEPCQLPK